MSQSPPPLNYAPPPPMHRRKIFRRWIALVVALAVAASSWWWGPIASTRVQLMYWQHQCMVYTPTTNQLIYDQGSRVGQTAAAWSKFYGILSPPGFRSDGTLFLHEMRKQNGERRLVAVDVDLTNFNHAITPENMRIEAWARVFKLGSVTQQPIEVYSGYDRNVASSGFGTILDGTTIYAGKPDPSQPDHFTFRTSDQNGQYLYDGWLQDDDRVVIEQRRSPAYSK